MTDGGKLGQGEEAQRRALRNELQRVEESARDSAQSQFEQAKLWRSVHLGLGVPTSILAAVSGALVLAVAALNILAGVLALLAAAGGAVLTTLNAAHRSNVASAAANAYLEVQTEARQTREIDLDRLPLTEVREQLAKLTARRDEQNRIAEVPSRRAYRRGQQNVREGGQTYAVDKSSSTGGT